MQALSASLRYFSLGEIVLTDNNGNAQNSITPYEMAFDVGYSRKLSEKFSMGVVFRYIYSDLGFHYDESSVSDASGASAFAADISGYYTHLPHHRPQRMPMVVGFQHLQHRYQSLLRRG